MSSSSAGHCEMNINAGNTNPMSSTADHGGKPNTAAGPD